MKSKQIQRNVGNIGAPKLNLHPVEIFLNEKVHLRKDICFFTSQEISNLSTNII